MRKFEDIMKEKLHGAKTEYSDKIWENVRKEIPIMQPNNSRFYWLAAFLFVFSTMIFMIHQFPNWKIAEEEKAVASIKAMDVSQFILSYEDIAKNQIRTSKSRNPVFGTLVGSPTVQRSQEVFTTKSTTIAEDVPVLSNLMIAHLPFNGSEEIISDKFIIGDPNSNFGQMAKLGASTFADDQEAKYQFHAPLYSLARISKYNVGLKIPSYQIPVQVKNKKKDVHCEVLQGSQSKFYLAARHVNSYAFNSLDVKNPSADDYMTSRHSTESKKYSFSDELAVGLEYRSGLFFELGVRYDQINEKFNYFDPNALSESTVIVSDTIVSEGMTQVIVDTVTTKLPGVREIVHNNRFRKISLPLSVGYQFPINKKVSVAARTGIVMNVWSKYIGKMFDENLDVVSIVDRQNGNNPFFNKLVHSVSASAYLQYKMNKRMEILVGLDGYKNIGSTSYDTNPIDQKYSSLGIFIGTKYNL